MLKSCHRRKDTGTVGWNGLGNDNRIIASQRPTPELAGNQLEPGTGLRNSWEICRIRPYVFDLGKENIEGQSRGRTIRGQGKAEARQDAG